MTISLVVCTVLYLNYILANGIAFRDSFARDGRATFARYTSLCGFIVSIISGTLFLHAVIHDDFSRKTWFFTLFSANFFLSSLYSSIYLTSSFFPFHDDELSDASLNSAIIGVLFAFFCVLGVVTVDVARIDRKKQQ